MCVRRGRSLSLPGAVAHLSEEHCTSTSPLPRVLRRRHHSLGSSEARGPAALSTVSCSQRCPRAWATWPTQGGWFSTGGFYLSLFQRHHSERLDLHLFREESHSKFRFTVFQGSNLLSKRCQTHPDQVTLEANAAAERWAETLRYRVMDPSAWPQNFSSAFSSSDQFPPSFSFLLWF